MTKETYSEFKDRIESFSRYHKFIEAEEYIPSKEVERKVREDGIFKPFMGDTIIYFLPREVQNYIYETFVMRFYDNSMGLSEYLSEPIKPQMLHVTLHDLNASECNDQEVSKMMVDMQFLLKRRKAMFDNIPNKINVKSGYVFNMVGQSIVLSVMPGESDIFLHNVVRPLDRYMTDMTRGEEEEYNKLMKAHTITSYASCIVHKYNYTPHITLSYFRNRKMEKPVIEALNGIANNLNTYENRFCFTLDKDLLYYSIFEDMNSFFPLFSL